MNTEIRTSITDRPITKGGENLLGIESYAEALSDFIMYSATPLTIGMQGEWGTGKTSLMNIIRENLENNKNSLATAWVNTWEFSLFKEANEITPTVLKGLLENLILHCKEKGYWNSDEKWEVAKKTFVKGLKVVGTFAAKVAVNKTTGQDVDINFDKASLKSEVAELKDEIQKVINLIIKSDKNPLNKVVFFIDDLDRIEPNVAVEILEAMKNIFDIENCVFVVAIDYEVVIKGLVKKFGEKTEKNEREFRSFFDKIIQVPFSMPINDYKIEGLIDEKLKDLGLDISKKLKNEYVEISKFTVGYIPRSIKRHINTFSLLRKIKSFSSSSENKDNEEEDFALFALIGLQIAFPQIYRLISKDPDFANWDEQFASDINIEYTDNLPFENNELFDETWEKILWIFCQKDIYLKSRTSQISEALNLLRKVLGRNTEEAISNSLSFSSMTNVDDDMEVRQKKAYSKTIFENWNDYYNSKKDTYSSVILDLAKELILRFEKDIENIYVKYTPTFVAFKNGSRNLSSVRLQKSGVKLEINNFGNIFNDDKYIKICTKNKNETAYIIFIKDKQYLNDNIDLIVEMVDNMSKRYIKNK